MSAGEQQEEKRKVQFTGGSTYIISLPKRWISQNQIEKGSFVNLKEEDGLLTIIPPGSKVNVRTLDEATLKLSTDDSSQTINRKLVSAYLAGYYSINIKPEKHNFSNSQRLEIKNFVRNLLVGTEIVSDASSQLKLQVLLTYPELTIQNALRRMSIIAASMHRDSISCMVNNDKELARELIQTDNEVDRFNLYLIRQLKKATYNQRILKEIGLDSGNDCSGYRLVSRYVERAADHAARIAEGSLSLKNPLKEETIRNIEKMSAYSIEMFVGSIEALFRKHYDGAEKIIQQVQGLYNLEKVAANSLSHADAEDMAVLRLIIESIRRTGEYACNISEIVLDLTVESIIT